MNTKEKVQNECQILRQWLYSRPYGEYNNTVRTIVAHCMINRNTWANWTTGRSKIPEAQKRCINEITLELSGVEIFKFADSGTGAEGVSVTGPGAALTTQSKTNMNRIIEFKGGTVYVERRKSAGIVRVDPCRTSELVELADCINETGRIAVVTVMPPEGQIMMVLDNKISNGDIIDAVCDAVGKVYDSDCTVKYAKIPEAL